MSKMVELAGKAPVPLVTGEGGSIPPTITMPKGPFSCILADPPWAFNTRSPKGLDGRPQHYPRMTLKAIQRLPVAEVAASDAWLFLWATGPHLPQAFSVIDAWGFKFSGMGFTWIKLNRNTVTLWADLTDDFMGGGYTTRKNAEFCLLARKGSPKRLRKGIREVIVSPIREHSRKPTEAYDRIEAYCSGPRLEMFARTTRPGWSVWGNETEKF